MRLGTLEEFLENVTSAALNMPAYHHSREAARKPTRTG